MRRVLSWLCFILLALPIEATPVSALQARTAVENWLAARPAAQMGAQFKRKISALKTIQEGGADAFHIASLEGGGFVVLSADDRIEPVIAFADSGTLEEDEKNPLWALLKRDIPKRFDAHQLGKAIARDVKTLRGRLRGRLRAFLTPSEEWKALLAGEATQLNSQANGKSSITDVRVKPLIASKWSQSKVGSKNCYNYYTPNNYVCGCVATAGAQVMRYHQYPTASVTPVTKSCWVSDEASDQTMLGGVYDWASMTLVPSSSITDAQRQAIGKLCYDVGVASRMDWTSSGSGACNGVLSQGFTDIFGYANSVCQISNVDSDKIENAIFANLDAKCPVVLGISGSGGHAIVADGYGCYEGNIYTHLNLGWSGSSDAWYLLPEVSTTSYDYDTLDNIVYNIFPTGEGELITGRVLDAEGEPVSGATVTGTKSGESVSTVSDENGIYALKVAKGTWSVSAKVAGGAEYLVGSVTVSSSSSTTLLTISAGSFSYVPLTGSVGNSWGNDITLPVTVTPEDDAWMDNTSDWMAKLWDRARLSQVMMPASHDSGMSESAACNNGVVPKGFFCTQDRTIAEQLTDGVRYFDLRPKMCDDGLRCSHRSDDLGGDGEKFEEIFKSAANFLAEHNGETVIFKVSHWNDSSTEAAEVKSLAQSYCGSVLYKASSSTVLNRVQLKDVRGKLILLLDDITPVTLSGYWGYSESSYASAKYFNVYDSYANSNSLSDMSADQLEKWRVHGGEPLERAFMLSWTLTMQVELSQIGSLTIKSMASEANAALEDALSTYVPKYGRPTLVNLDYISQELCRTIIAYNAGLLASDVDLKFGEALPDDATAGEIADVLERVSDGYIKRDVTTLDEYRKLCQWATDHGIAFSAVNNSAHAYLSYLLDLETLLDREIPQDSITLEKLGNGDEAGTKVYRVSLKDIVIGENATEAMLLKAFWVKGSINVRIRSMAVENGAVRVVLESGSEDSEIRILLKI